MRATRLTAPRCHAPFVFGRWSGGDSALLTLADEPLTLGDASGVVAPGTMLPRNERPAVSLNVSTAMRPTTPAAVRYQPGMSHVVGRVDERLVDDRRGAAEDRGRDVVADREAGVAHRVGNSAAALPRSSTDHDEEQAEDADPGEPSPHRAALDSSHRGHREQDVAEARGDQTGLRPMRSVRAPKGHDDGHHDELDDDQRVVGLRHPLVQRGGEVGRHVGQHQVERDVVRITKPKSLATWPGCARRRSTNARNAEALSAVCADPTCRSPIPAACAASTAPTTEQDGEQERHAPPTGRHAVLAHGQRERRAEDRRRAEAGERAELEERSRTSRGGHQGRAPT